MNGRRDKLSILPLFEDDLNEIVDYITYCLRNPLAAEHLADEVERVIEDQLDCVESFEPYPSSRERKYSYYRIQVKNFSIFYVMIGNTMEVRRMIYSRRNLKDLI